MGNLPSVQVESEELLEKDEDRANQLHSLANADADGGVYDYSILFDTEGLLKALVDIKDVDDTNISRKKGELEQWLKNLTKRGESSVSDVEFVDFASNKGIPKEEAQKFFSELDPDNEGCVEITFFLQMLKDKHGPTMEDMMMMPCSHLPGVVDAYLIERPSSSAEDLGFEIIKFLRRYRVDPSNLAPHTMNQLIGLFCSREQMINGQYLIVQEKQKDELASLVEDDEQRVTVTKCFSTISSSSNDGSVSKLTDGNFDTYWQSNGSPRSHWIRLNMLPGVRLKELAVGVNTSDDSYMPKVMAVSVGNSPSNLKELKSVSIPREHNGQFVLLGALSAEYSVIQINIRQCHSDGCDTRVRQVYVKGYRQKKEEDMPTVLDGLVMWYLGLISSVSKAAMPVAPNLRGTLLTQSKYALQYLPPLSLSKSSPYKPEFLTPVILREMETFIKSLCLPGDNYVSLDSESLSVLIGFSLSIGNINTILDCLLNLLDNMAVSLSKSAELMKKLATIEQKKFIGHCRVLSLTFVKCDCKSEEGYSIENILTNNALGSGSPFKSVKEVKVANVVLKENKAMFQPVKINIKVPPTDNSPRAVLLFGLEDMGNETEDFFARFSKYDSFTMDDWENMKKDKPASDGVYDDGLMGYLEQSKDSKEFEMSFPSTSRPVKYLLLKFVGQESSERVTVHSVKVKGYRITQQQIEIRTILQQMADLVSSNEGGGDYDCGQVMARLLVFLCRLLLDFSLLFGNKMASDPESLQETHICMDNFSLEKIWNLYIPLNLSMDNSLLNDCSLLCLILLRNGVQFLKSPSTAETKNSTSSNSSKEPDAALEQGGVALRLEDVSQKTDIASEVLTHLCSLVDSSNSKPIVQSLAKDIIKEGVVVFFPGTKARKKYLLDMIDVILAGEQPPSWWLKFEALCNYFSHKDNNSLLELNWNIEKIDAIIPENILSILKTIVTVATKQVKADLKSKAVVSQDYLVKLLCSMQSSLLFWCKHLLTCSNTTSASNDASTDDKSTAVSDDKQVAITTGVKDVLKEYVSCIKGKCLSVLEKVKNEEDMESILKILEKSIVGQSLSQLVSFLGSFSSMESLPFIDLLNTLQPLSTIIGTICTTVPSIAPELNSDELKCKGDDMIAVWTRESKHNYEDNSKISEDFVCPGANKFIVEFDSRCHTERRYDYLTFSDSFGTKVQYDDNYGSDRWPTRGEFKGPKLTFHFHSDGSNNYWGYKFTIKAYGKSIPPLHWLYDLHICMSRLFGQFVSSLISGQTASIKPSIKKQEKKEEESLLKSDLWKTLFRGGAIDRKFIRSLSGAYEAISPQDTEVCSMLYELAESDETPSLIELCRSVKPLPSFGGPLVDKVIGAVFAALIWHSQEIREELGNMNNKSSSLKPPVNVIDAFTAAEALRRELVESRQKVLEAKEKEEDEAVKAKMDEDEPLRACHDKAMFLLKFAGLTRVSYDSKPGSPVTRRPSWGQKSWKMQRSQSVVSTVNRIKQQISRETKPLSPAEKHPCFETVLNFVRNTGLTVANVETLLQERAELARRMCEGYSFAAEYLRVMSLQATAPEIPLLSFLQHLLVHQRKFPRHYTTRVDGCGLNLENMLRKSFQLFVHRLIDVIRVNSQSIKSVDTGSDGLGLVKNVFSHFMDISWQDYDLNLLKDLQFPDYLFESVIGSSVAERQIIVDKFDDEDEMMKKYELYEKFLKKWEEVSRFTEFLATDVAQEDIREANMFVGAIASNPTRRRGTRVNCDGCRTQIENDWYKDMDIDEECDLCTMCFTGGTGNRPSSFSKDHVLLHMGHHLCTGCDMSIVTHRFLRQSDKKNFCLGCFRKESSDCDWTVYLMKECPATETANKFKSTEHSKPMEYRNGILTELKSVSEGVQYNRQHNWLLYSSLTLMMANRLNNKENTDPQYLRHACELLMTCLQLVVQGLKFALSAAKSTAALKQRELEQKQKEEAEEKLKKEEEERQQKEQEESKVETDVGQPTESKGSEGDTEVAGTHKPPQDGVENTLSVEEPMEVGPQDNSPAEEPMDVGSQNDSPSEEPGPQDISTAKEPMEIVPQNIQEGGNESTEEHKASDKAADEVDYKVIVDDDAQPRTGRSPSLRKQEAISDATNIDTPVIDDGVSNSERAFGLMFYESMIGLLASVLPKQLSLLPWINVSGTVEQIVGDAILPQLFRIARSKDMTASHRLQAMTVAIKYMSRVSPEVADHAIEVLENGVSEGSTERKKTNGHKTVDYLFEMGVSSLKESNISNAASVTDCLLLLHKNPEWRSTISQRIADSVSKASSSVTDLSVIFSLLLLAGFPKLAKVGSSVKWSKGSSSDEENRGVIVSPVTDSQANVINIQTRKSHSLKLSDMTVESCMEGCVQGTMLSELVPIMKSGIQQCNKESNDQVEHRWILSLVLKALGVLLKGAKKNSVIECVLSENILPSIVKQACKPTHFSKQWILSDLEILGVSCYKPYVESIAATEDEATAMETTDGPKDKTEEALDKKNNGVVKKTEAKDPVNDKLSPVDKESEYLPDLSELESTVTSKPETGYETESVSTKPDTEDKLVLDTSDVQIGTPAQRKTTSPTVDRKKISSPKEDTTPVKSKAELEEQAALRGLSEEIQEMLKIMKDAFQCTLAQVRAMYEAAEQDMDKFIMSSDKYYDSATSGLKLPQDIIDASRRWMTLEHSSSIRDTLDEYQEDQEDTGVTGFLTVNVDLKKIDPRPENPSELKKSMELLPNSKESKKKQKESSEREKSHQLLQDQLKEIKKGPIDRDLMLKVHRAQVILHAREVLTSLLLHWPQEAPKLNFVLLGGLESSHWFSLLDFLVKNKTQEERDKVLKRVVACSEPDELVTLGLTAAQCMKEVIVDMTTKDFKYQPEKKTYTGKVVMSSAACMKVVMEKRHSLIGTVQIAADEGFTEHQWSWTGEGEEKKEEQEWNIPGNVVHYKITLDKIEKSDQKKLWSMKVSGIQKGRFETSYSLLHILLDTPRATPTSDGPPTLLPIIKLWPSLIAAACELTGEQRIKVIGILLQLLLWNSSAQKTEGVGASSSGASGATPATDKVQRLDLAMLKPLWTLYTSMSKEYDKGEKNFHLKPEILRALTELFLVVENTALEWRTEQDLLLETITDDNLSQMLQQGITNVAYLSIGLGLSNKVADAFIEAKKNYVPPPPPLPNDGIVASSSSSSDVSSSSSSSSSSPTDSFDDSDYY